MEVCENVALLFDEIINSKSHTHANKYTHLFSVTWMRALATEQADGDGRESGRCYRTVRSFCGDCHLFLVLVHQYNQTSTAGRTIFNAEC